MDENPYKSPESENAVEKRTRDTPFWVSVLGIAIGTVFLLGGPLSILGPFVLGSLPPRLVMAVNWAILLSVIVVLSGIYYRYKQSKARKAKKRGHH